MYGSRHISVWVNDAKAGASLCVLHRKVRQQSGLARASLPDYEHMMQSVGHTKTKRSVAILVAGDTKGDRWRLHRAIIDPASPSR
jgi:hypothetical protein